MVYKDYYDVFGVFCFVLDVDIKFVYCKFVKQYYFDKNQGDEKVVDKFKEIGEVYVVFNDFEKCKLYDQYGYIG